MRINIINLKTLYDTASGEIPVNRKALDYYWPVVFSIDHLGYLLENRSKKINRPVLSEDTLGKLLYAFENMANATERKKSPSLFEIPEVAGHPNIQKEIRSLQQKLQVIEEIKV